MCPADPTGVATGQPADDRDCHEGGRQPGRPPLGRLAPYARTSTTGTVPLKLSPDQYSEYIDQKWPYPSEEASAVAPYHMKLYYDVRRYNLPNYMYVRRDVPSELNCDRWDTLLKDYPDRQVCDFLRYGWPVTYTAPSIPTPSETNHASATRHPVAVKSFIDKELQKEALLGLFSCPPFSPWTQTSPIMTRDKSDGSGKRVIIDLSFPEGSSVNDGILKNFYQGVENSYNLPTAIDLGDVLLEGGKGTFMWKSDLTRAYRQLRVDPLDYPLLAIQHDGSYYVDVCPSFGCRASGVPSRGSPTLSPLSCSPGAILS